MVQAPPVYIQVPPSTNNNQTPAVNILGEDGKILSKYLPTTGKTEESYASRSVFPATGEVNVIYYSQLAAEADKTWEWSTILNDYRLTSATGIQSLNNKTGAEITLNADDIAEKATTPANKYFTEARALASKLAGYTKATAYKAIAATDTVFQAISMLEFITEQKVNKNNSKLEGIPTTPNVVDTEAAPANDLQVANVKFVKDRLGVLALKDKSAAFKTFAAGTTTVTVTVDFSNDENRVPYAATRNIQLALPAAIVPDAARTLYFDTGNTSVKVTMPVNSNTSTGPKVYEASTEVTIPPNKSLAVTLDPTGDTPADVRIFYVLQP